MNNIYIVLVTYNHNIKSIYGLVENLTHQSHRVVICNNSNYNIILDNNKVTVFNFGENLGVASAQSIGMKWAFDNGADFIVQIDQDSTPDTGLVKNLLESYHYLIQKGIPVGLIGAQDFDNDTKIKSKDFLGKPNKINNTNYFIVSAILSSGSLVPKSTYDLVGGMDNDLFIDMVDFEYCWRITNKGYLIIKNKDALLGHSLGTGKQKSITIFTINSWVPIRHYYQYRNTLYMLCRGYVPVKWKLVQIVKLPIKTLMYALFFDDRKERLKYILRGIKDFTVNKQGILK